MTPLPESRQLLEQFLRALMDYLRPIEQHLQIANQRQHRFRAIADRAARGIAGHPGDEIPMPQYCEWPNMTFPDELSGYVDCAGMNEAIQTLEDVCRNIEPLVRKNEYTLEEAMHRLRLDDARIECIEKAIEPLRDCRRRMLAKLGEPNPSTIASAELDAPAHSPDFRSVNWHGTAYSFSASQAACVKSWWEAWSNGTPDVGDDYVCETAEVNSRLNALFARSDAWGTMIVEGETKGTHRLAAPQ